MTTEVRVPTLGESVTEATVATWFKKPGDAVAADEMLCELETDKVTVEVPAPAAGVDGRNRCKRRRHRGCGCPPRDDHRSGRRCCCGSGTCCGRSGGGTGGSQQAQPMLWCRPWANP